MQSKSERLEMIRRAAKNFQAKQARLAKFEREESREVVEDERYWTDASKYANEYYGEVYRATVRFDNDWD
jgi:acyl-CoA reductase-like NAD-dependent aldehyde dehydrogenase